MKCTLQELKKLSNKISKRLTAGVSIYLTGNLGSGKTTFTKFLVSELFKKNKKNKPEVTSPTFNIVQYYKVSAKLIIAHYDLYRLKSTRDLNHIGLYDFEDSLLSIIEWPRLIKKKNKNRIEVKFKYTKKKDERNVEIKYFGKVKK